MIDIEHKIARIRQCAGEPFRLKGRRPFTYVVQGEVVQTDRTDYLLPLSDFRKALELVPIDGPGVINQVVRGPSYVWAILHDPRISEGDW